MMTNKQQDFCTCEEQACFRKHINGFLKTLDKEVAEKEKFESLCQWLTTFDCVDSAKVLKGVIYTEPSVHRISVTFNQSGGETKRLLNIWNKQGELSFKSLQ